jgi:hypothetical protein
VCALAAACLTIVLAADLQAQNPAPLTEAPERPEFMSRFDFHMTAAGVSDPDPRFSWDTHWGGDFDFVDYVFGRVMFLADYQVVLGRENRLFDPNQGNYTLEVSASYRYKGTEFAAVLHHVSRHLSDRPNDDAIAWNVAGLRLLRQLQRGKQTITLRLEGGPVIARAYVDYGAIGLFDATIRRPLSPRTALYGRVYADYYVTDPDVVGRSNQNGGRFEAGLRISGKGGGLDLFGGYEKVVDAYPLDRQPKQWAFAGFRLVN